MTAFLEIIVRMTESQRSKKYGQIHIATHEFVHSIGLSFVE